MTIQTRKEFAFPENAPCAICKKDNPDSEMSFSISIGNTKATYNNIPVHSKCEIRYDVYKVIGFLVFAVIGYLITSFTTDSNSFVCGLVGFFVGSIAVTFVKSKLENLTNDFIKTYARLSNMNNFQA